MTDLSPGGYHGYLLAPAAAHGASSMRQGAQARENGPRWVHAGGHTQPARVKGEGSRGSVLEFDGSGAVFLPFAGLFGASQLSLTWRARLCCTSDTCGTQVMWSMHTLKGWILRAEVTPQSPVSPGSGGEKQEGAEGGEGGDGRGSMHAAVVWVEIVMQRHPFQHVLASVPVPVPVLERAWHTQDTLEGGNAEEAHEEAGRLKVWVSFSLSMSSDATEPILFAAWVDDDQAQAEQAATDARRFQRGQCGHQHRTTRAAGMSAPLSSYSNHRWSSFSSCPSLQHNHEHNHEDISCRSDERSEKGCDEHTEKAFSEHNESALLGSPHTEAAASREPVHSQANERGGGGGRGAPAGNWHVDRKQQGRQGRCKQHAGHDDADEQEHCGYSSAMDKTFIHACAPMPARVKSPAEASGEALEDGQCGLFSPHLADAVAECSRQHECGGVTFSPRRGVFELRRGPHALVGDSQVEGEVSWVKRGGKCSRHVAVIPPNRCMTYTSPPGGKRRCNRWGAYLPFTFETGCSTRAFLVDETGRRPAQGGVHGVHPPKNASSDIRARFEEVNWIVSLKGCSNDFWVLAADGIAGIWLGSTDGDEVDTLGNRSAVDSLVLWNTYWSLDSLSQDKQTSTPQDKQTPTHNGLDSLSQACPPDAPPTPADTDTETGQDTEGRMDADATAAGDERVHGGEGSGVPGVHDGHLQHQTPAEDVSGGAHQGRREEEEEGVDGDGSEARVQVGETATQGHGGAGGSRYPGQEALCHLQDLRGAWQRESDVEQALSAVVRLC